MKKMDLGELIEPITVDANGEGEHLRTFREASEDDVAVLCEATVPGAPVQMTKFDSDGNQRRGLIAMCARADGTEYAMKASGESIPVPAQGGRCLPVAPSPCRTSKVERSCVRTRSVSCSLVRELSPSVRAAPAIGYNLASS